MGYQKIKGSRDLPIESEEEDLFELSSYYEGLSDFISCCETPMTVALQGDWGSGKTSMMNNIEKKLKNCQVIRFDTWQYSFLNNSGGLISAFMNNIVNSVIKELGFMEKSKSELYEGLLSILKMYRFSAQIGLPGIASFGCEADFDKLLDKEDNFYNSIETFKKLFEKNVEEVLKKKRYNKVVIFIDDLDRLCPSRAVELLEIIKIFLDVRGCVFVLAIDYEVVIMGVRQKYGDNLMYQKGKSFFDKMIQLPFQIPVSFYNMEKLVKKSFESMGISTEESTEAAELVSESVGTNPRTVKRLLNTFELHRHILKFEMGEDAQKKNLYLLYILIVQLYNEPFYHYLINNLDWRIPETGKDTIFTYGSEEHSDESEYEYLNRVLDTNGEYGKELDVKKVKGYIKKLNHLLEKDPVIREENINLFYKLLIQSQITASSQAADSTAVWMEISRDLDLSGYIILGVRVEGYPELTADNFRGVFIETIQTAVPRNKFRSFVKDRKRTRSAGLPDRIFDNMDNGSAHMSWRYPESSIKEVHGFPIVMHYNRQDLKKILLDMLKGLEVTKKVWLKVKEEERMDAKEKVEEAENGL